MLSASDLEAIKKLQSRFKALAQEITEFYLLPFDGTPKANLYDGKLERVSYGAMHVNRTAGLVIPIWKFYCWLGDKDALNLSEEEIFLLQIVVGLHEKARKSDAKDKNLWEKESQAFCEKFLIDNGISPATAKRFAFLIRQKEKGGILGEIFQTSDALDIMRNKKALILKKISLYYNCKDRPQAMRALIPFVAEIRALIAQQHDLKYPCEIKIDENSAPLVSSIPATRDDGKPGLKVAYEQAKNCYEKVTADFAKAKFPMLQALCTGNFQSDFILKTSPEPETLKDVFFAKSIRGGQYCFAEEMANDLTRHELLPMDHVERRLSDKREWMAVPEGVVKTSEKVPIYSEDEKKYFSSINSWTLITKKGIVPIFNFDKSEKLAGFIVKPESILLYYLSTYDNGTVGRLNHFDTEEAAWNYYERKVLGNNPKLYPRRLIKKFIELVENSDQYNEILLRAKLAEDFCSGIFADNISSRLLARYYRRVALRAVEYLFKEKGKEIPKDLDIPICFYLPNKPQNWQLYTALQASKDDEIAAATWKNEKLRNEQFAKNNFEFLLFGNSIEDVLEKTFYKDIPILLYILRQGYIHIAEELLLNISSERVHYHLSRLIPYLNKKPWFSFSTNEQTYQEPAMPYLGLKKDHTLWIWFKQQGANIHSVDADGNTALLKAAIAGKAEQALYLLEQGLNVNHQNSKGEAALHGFVRWKQKAMTEKLLKAGAKVDVQDNDANTPLQIAVNKNYFELIKLLVAAGANINKPGKYCWTALHYAVAGKNLDLVKYFIAMKGNPHLLTEDGESLLLLAAKSSLTMVQYLVEQQKLDVNHKDKIGTTALHIAAENGQFAIVKYLIEQGADCNKALSEKRSNDSAFAGWTAVDFAIQALHYEVAKYLCIQHEAKFYDAQNLYQFLKWAIRNDDLLLIQYIADKAKIDIHEVESYHGESPLDIAVKQISNVKFNSDTNFNIIKYLLKKWISLSKQTCDKLITTALQNDDAELLQLVLKHNLFFAHKGREYPQNILDQGLKEGKYGIVKFLHREKYASAHFDQKVIVPLMKFSIKNDDVELFQLLRQDVERIFINDYQPIHLAAQRGSIDIVTHLIEVKVNIDSVDKKGATALHYAAAAGQLEVVTYLHQKGASLEFFNYAGVSALHQAMIHSRYEVVKYFAAHFSDDQLQKQLEQIDPRKVPHLKTLLRSVPRLEKVYLEISQEKMTQLHLMTDLLMQQSEIFHADTNNLKLEEEDEPKPKEKDKSALEILPLNM